MDTMNNIPSLNYLMANQLTADDLNEEVEYLIENFLVKSSLNVFFAKAGQGKSFLMLALAVSLIKGGQIEQCIYLDMDNSKAALKNRNIDKLLVKHPELTYIHNSKIYEDSSGIIDKLASDARKYNDAFKGVLFIFDSIRDFMGGRDMNSDRDIMPLMAQLKELREAGATIIFLHHTTKESDGQLFKGSTSFIDSVDVGYALSSKRSGNHLSYQLMVYKDRISVESCAFELNTETMELQSENLKIASMSEHEASFVQDVQGWLAFYGNDGVKQSELLKRVGKSPDDKTARKYLQKHIDDMWKVEKRPAENNATYYFPMELPNLPIVPDQLSA